MAHLWSVGERGEWVATPVGEGMADGGSMLRKVGREPEVWVLLGPIHARARVNGESVPLGIVVLADRDELRVPGSAARFFSTETIARVELFPAASRGGRCPRCKQTIECGTRAVRCPSCGLWHHSSDELPCWTYAVTCAACAQDTTPDAGFRWTPEEL